MPEPAPFDLPFEEAIEFFRSKGFALTPEGWAQLWAAANAQAFTVARVTQMDVLMDIREAVDQALAEGTSLGEFKRQLRPLLERKGWFAPTGETAVDAMPDGTMRKRLTPWRLENIYRTNLQSAYSTGRYQQMMETAEDRPYWQYMAILDKRTRPAHAAMHGKVYDHRHPVWDKWYPPNGFNCRCYVKTLSERQVRQRGLEVQTAGVDVAPDAGWDYNVGKEGLDAWKPDLSKYPPRLADQLERDLNA